VNPQRMPGIVWIHYHDHAIFRPAKAEIRAKAGQRIKGPTTGGHQSAVSRNTTIPARDPPTLNITGRARNGVVSPKTRIIPTPKAAPIRKAGNSMRTLAAKSIAAVYPVHPVDRRP